MNVCLVTENCLLSDTAGIFDILHIVWRTEFRYELAQFESLQVKVA